ncbi:hypothetical protein FHX42_005090 [Saccharopolyspora lacisalsi]|uniref:Secreted protein n=1 Tax=Halosaccharopolyspora lacisalsi TaxID=1000566 RepID=A0A839E707_9PSEU|nr:hypothetical protein [Halosaccharopolyspora lacisalsi]MBA8827685.1 hypothetical protein [Halosaccharopolyspora lacisalsi]
MQTWAKRGVRAALVTGGMLAAGSGVASASEDCPDRPAPPLGETTFPQGADVLDDGTPRRNGLCFAGELFPTDTPRNNPAPGKHTVAALTGPIDPVTEVIPVVDDVLTQEIPRVPEQPTTGRHRSTDPETTEIPVIDPEPTTERAPRPDPSETTSGPPASSGRHALEAESGSPAEGFHRSSNSSDAIGDVVHDTRGAIVVPTIRDHEAPLVVPAVDPATVDGFAAESTQSIVELWKSSLGKTVPAPAGEPLLSPRTVDLTSAGLPAKKLHTVPRELLDSAVSTVPAARREAQEFLPLHVPGDMQHQVTEIPNPSEAAELVVAPAPRAEESEPSRITQVLRGELLPEPRADEPAAAPAFSTAPELSEVVVFTADELAVALPERDEVARNPFRRSTRTAPTGGMSLPVVDDGGALPTVTVAQGETLASVFGNPVTEQLRAGALLRDVAGRA